MWTDVDMSYRRARLALLCLIFKLGYIASALAATMTYPLAEGTNWNLTVNLEGNDASSPTAGGRVRYPEYPQGFPYNEVSFQGEGAMNS